jgi:hypothetical protein
MGDPQKTEGGGSSPTVSKLQPVEHWAEKHSPLDWELAAARAHNRWVIGQEISEKAFLDGLKEAKEVSH